MFALISPDEIQLGNNGEILGQRVAQISEEIFEVAPPLFWIEFIPQDYSVIYYYKDNQIMFEEYVITQAYEPLVEIQL
jgi:hypothetical protein